MVNMVMAAMVLLLVTNNAGRGDDVNDDCVDADESGDDDESGRDYVRTYLRMVMMVTYVRT